jgi:ankyrin repeat protein
MAYVGYGFETTWEVEHGLGFAMNGKRILEVGDDEVASEGAAAGTESRAGKAPKRLNFEDLNEAAFEKNLPWVKALLKAGANPEISPDGPGSSAIENCVFADKLPVLRELLKYAKRPISRHAMSTANRLGDQPVLKLLREHDARIRHKR